MDLQGNERYQHVAVSDAEACQKQVGKARAGGKVKYAAWGDNWGCHTYMDFFPDTHAHHGDRISSAWEQCQPTTPSTTSTTPSSSSVCKVKVGDVSTNFGVTLEGDERYHNAGALDAKACQQQVGKQRPQGTVKYAALGVNWGCHTYLDYAPSSIATHGDTISEAWHTCQ